MSKFVKQPRQPIFSYYMLINNKPQNCTVEDDDIVNLPRLGLVVEENCLTSNLNYVMMP